MTKDILSLLIPIISIVMGCGIPIVWIVTDYRKRKAMFALHHQERMAAIEKGIELPPLPIGLLSEDFGSSKPRSPHSDFGWGLFWLLGGVALLIATYFNDKGAESLYSLVPIAIGVHYLIYYAVVGKKEALAIEAEQKAKAAEINRGSLS